MRQNKILLILSIVLSCILSLVKLRYGSVLSSNAQKETYTILLVGDVMLGRSVNQNIQKNHDATWPFKNISALTQSPDITIGNLESPLVSNCPVTISGMIFCGETSNALGLKSAGFDFVSFANNHANNYGASGITSTLEALSNYGVTALTASTPVYTKLGKATLALVAFDDVSRLVDINHLQSLISSLHNEADFVLVYFHWGSEYQTTSNLRQRSLAHATIEAGADLVVGTHPHVVQESEWYLGKPIYYSLGNFVFDQEWSDATRHGQAIRLSIKDSMITTIDEIPIGIKNYGQSYIKDL